jgi:streptogramin lyase
MTRMHMYIKALFFRVSKIARLFISKQITFQTVFILSLFLLSNFTAFATTIVEYPVPTSASLPYGITQGPDGNIWFAEVYGNRVGSITITGTITEYSTLPNAGSNPLVITQGPDGNLWFTENAANQIGRITPAGTITEYPLTANSSPWGITSGPDNNLWFTEFGANSKTGSVTTTGTISEHQLPTSSGPASITQGPDGNLWFVEYRANQIGVMNTNGVLLAEHPINTTNSQPFGISSGPDGNLWFTESYGNKIGVMNTAGVLLHEYPIPTANSSPFIIVQGADGNLWFTENATNQIGRITPAGTITEYPLPASSAPWGITAGSDGNIWFTESGANNIGVLYLTPNAPALSINSGATTGGTTLNISGTNFIVGSTVTFGGNAATVNSITSTNISVTAPAGTVTGTPVDVVIANSTSTTTILASFTYIQPIPTFTATSSVLTDPSTGSISTSQTVNSGSAASFNLTPISPYTNITMGGTCGGTLNGTTYTTNTITANCTVTASFTIPTFTATSSVLTDPSTGSISTSQTVNSGSAASFTLTPISPYTNITMGGTCGGTLNGTTYTTNAITTNCTVTASFSIPTFTATSSVLTDPSRGSISASQAVNSGSTASFTLTPISPYTNITMGGTCGGTLNGTTYTTNAITANCTVMASFSIPTFTASSSVLTDPSRGSISASQTINSGSQAAFTLTPISPYTNITMGGTCGGTLNGTTYTTNAITANCTVIASFSMPIVTATSSLITDSSRGTISAPQTINSGSQAIFTLTPIAPYTHITMGGTCGGTLNGTTYTTNTLTNNCTVTASFSIPTFTATSSVTTDPGTGSISASQTIDSGSRAAFTVTPIAPYTQISMGGTCGGTLSGTTYTTNAITTNCTVTASFTIPTLLSIAVGPLTPSIAQGGTQQFTAMGSYSNGTTADITTTVTWTSNIPSIAAISNISGSKGLATASNVNTGTTSISASLGLIQSTNVATLAVTASPLISLLVTPSTATIGTGTTQQYTAIGTYGNGSTQDLTNIVTWTESTGGNIVMINSSGLATGLAPGATNIRASLNGINNLPDNVILTVTQTAIPVLQVTPPALTISAGGTGSVVITNVGAPGSIATNVSVLSYTNSINNSLSGTPTYSADCASLTTSGTCTISFTTISTVLTSITGFAKINASNLSNSAPFPLTLTLTPASQLMLLDAQSTYSQTTAANWSAWNGPSQISTSDSVFNDFASNGTMMVAVGNGTIAYKNNSAGGWLSNAFNNINFNAISYYAGTWIAVGQDMGHTPTQAVIYRSQDGINWNPSQSITSTTTLNSITTRTIGGNTLWIAAGTDKDLSSQILINNNSDGSGSWNAAALPAPVAPSSTPTHLGPLYKVVCDNVNLGVCVAVGDVSITDSNGTILTSTDGLTWTKNTIVDPSLANIAFESVAYNGSRWMIVGFGPTFLSASDPNQTWANSTPTATSPAAFSNINWDGNSTWFAVGYAGGLYYNNTAAPSPIWQAGNTPSTSMLKSTLIYQPS